MAKFEPLCEMVIMEREGGYHVTDNPNDRGGQTCAGISRRANPDWQGWRLIDSGVAPTDSRVKSLIYALYRHAYWEVIRGDDIADAVMAQAVYSCAVLSGARTASRLAQRACGVEVDGFIGQHTLTAMNGMSADLFLAVFTLARIDRYRRIVKNDPTQRDFLLGWINRAFGAYPQKASPARGTGRPGVGAVAYVPEIASGLIGGVL